LEIVIAAPSARSDVCVEELDDELAGARGNFYKETLIGVQARSGERLTDVVTVRDGRLGSERAE
jgi:hypothetical protein